MVKPHCAICWLPIQDVLNDPATTEVVVQRLGEVGIERHGQWSWRSVEAFDFQRLDAIGLLHPDRSCRSRLIQRTRSA